MHKMFFEQFVLLMSPIMRADLLKDGGNSYLFIGTLVAERELFLPSLC